MEKFSYISKFIRENDLKLFTDVSDDLFCFICKRIMINATTAPCGCRYCYECIEEFLKVKTNLFCPGSAKYCKTDKLNFKQDISVDKINNNRISKLIVKCPQKTCEFQTELNLIKDHMEVCDKQTVGCPYLQLGCIKEDVLSNMKPHLYDDSFVHNKLLIEYINNFKNDVEILKNNMKTMADENVVLKEQIMNNNLSVERKELELNEITKKIQNENKTTKEEIKFLLTKNKIMESFLMHNIEELKESIENIEEKYVNYYMPSIVLLRNNMKTMADENVTLKKQIMNNNLNVERKELKLNEIIERIQNEKKTTKEEIKVLLAEIETLKSAQNNEELKESIEHIEEKQKSLAEDAANAHKDISVLSGNSDKWSSSFVCFNDTLESMKDKIKNIENQFTLCKDEEFVWKIDNISEKVKFRPEDPNKIFYSESFYTHKNGYKMCLYVFPNKFPNRMGVFFSIMKGEFDDILPWPCKLDVTTSLACQLTGMMFLYKTKQYIYNTSHDVYRKPIFEKNKGCLALNYIELNRLLGTEQLVKNNQLFIKCRVHVNF